MSDEIPSIEAENGGHTLFEHTDCNDAACIYCMGGLCLCTICKGFEGTLTSACPGKEVSEHDGNLVYHATLDFRHGKWRKRPLAHHEKEDPAKDALVDEALDRLNDERNPKCGFCLKVEADCVGQEEGHPFMSMDLSDDIGGNT